MRHHTEYLGTTITFGLPQWIECFNYTRGDGHSRWNRVTDELSKIAGNKGECVGPQCWIEYEYEGSTEHFASVVEDLREQINTILDRFYCQLSIQDRRTYEKEKK